MTQILHTTLNQGRAVLAAGETFQMDLPVNPLSVVLLTFRAVNESLLLAQSLASWFAKYTNINIRYRGASIIDGRLDDLMVAMMLRGGWGYGVGQENNVLNDVRSITIPLMFGRKAYDDKECFPATRRGDLILSLTAGAEAGTGLVTHSVQVETVELLDAVPERFIKITETQQAMAAAGQNNIALPVGNKLLGALLRPFAFPTAAVRTSSFGEVSLELDNVEAIYSHTNWETLHGSFARRVHPAWTGNQHVHPYNAAAVATEYLTREATSDFALHQQYGYLDFDPNNDGAYAVETKDVANLNLAIVSGTADVANVSRVYPVELVETGAAAA